LPTQVSRRPGATGATSAEWSSSLGRRVAVAIFAGALFPHAVQAASGSEAGKAGAYCPLPAPGQKPSCLAPAQQEYGAFFAAVQEGRVEPTASDLVEADLAGASGTERAYLALSSVSYGYFRLAEQIGVRPDADPILLARLARWNDLLLGLYGQSNLDPGFRAAIRDMANDLHRHTVGLQPSCAATEFEHCGQTAELVRAMASMDRSTGVRSPLAQILQRMLGPEIESASEESPD
jgi:hypothetical protein